MKTLYNIIMLLNMSMKWSVAASSVRKTGSSSAVSGGVPAAVVRSRIPALLPRPLCITQAGRLQPHSGGYSPDHVSIDQVYKDALTLKNTCKSMFWLIVEVFIMPTYSYTILLY